MNYDGYEISHEFGCTDSEEGNKTSDDDNSSNNDGQFNFQALSQRSVKMYGDLPHMVSTDKCKLKHNAVTIRANWGMSHSSQ